MRTRTCALPECEPGPGAKTEATCEKPGKDGGGRNKVGKRVQAENSQFCPQPYSKNMDNTPALTLSASWFQLVPMIYWIKKRKNSSFSMDRIYIRWSEKTATGLARQPRLLRSLEEKRLNYKKYLYISNFSPS